MTPCSTSSFDFAQDKLYSNLRTALKGSLKEKDSQKFIESDGSKNYRLSTHPDFVTYDHKKLKTHPEYKISCLIEVNTKTSFTTKNLDGLSVVFKVPDSLTKGKITHCLSNRYKDSDKISGNKS